MKKAALLFLAAALACSREKTYSTPAPTASASDGSDTWVAQPGDLSPEQVRMVQRALGDRGFATEPSGTFDDQTKVALSDFQRSRGLPTTGNLNADTAAALGIDPKDVMPVRGTSPEPRPDVPAAEPQAPSSPSSSPEAPQAEPTDPAQPPMDAPAAPGDAAAPR